MSRIASLLLLLLPSLAAANPPVASYIFPAGAQRGTKVNIRVGGLFLYNKCGLEMLGSGITAPAHLNTTKTTWFEGPLLPLPDSQRQEDYPKDMAGSLALAADAPLGVRYWRVWTSQGAASSMRFIVGDLPEIVEDEIDGDAVPVTVTLPVTINGRIFPREDLDIYTFSAKKGEAIRCEVHAARLGSPLDARLEVRDPQGRRLTESDAPTGSDPVVRFIAPTDGVYQVRIDDVRTQGGQAFVYRLTVTAAPFVEQVFPLGGRRGTAVAFEVVGQGVPATQSIAIPREAPIDFSASLIVRGKQTNSLMLDTDDHPEFIAPKDLTRAIPLPAVLNGRISTSGQMDTWKLQGKKGDTWELDLRAARLGSKLDGILTIADREGKTLARAEANPADPTLRFNVPADGEYHVQVQDRFRSRGGPEFAYRLRIVPPPAADFRLTFSGDARQGPGADAITLPRKGTAKLKVNAERLGGFKEPINLEIQGIPAGVTVTPTVIAANQASVDLTFKADETAKIDVARLTVIGAATPAPSVSPIQGRSGQLKRTAGLQVGRGMPEQPSILLAVALPTPFVIKGVYDMGFAPRGGMHRHSYKIERKGYDGPIEVSLADRQARHLQGVEGPTIVIPAGVSEFTYSAYLPPWMETGRTCRVCVQGVGVIKEPNGSEHRVSFSSVNQNEQLVAVVGPGMLAMEAERTSFTAAPGKQFLVPVQIRRGQGLEGPVELELIAPPHLRGLSAAKIAIGAKDSRGTLVINCADKLGGPFNMPILVRATMRQNGNPVVAEVKLDVQP